MSHCLYREKVNISLSLQSKSKYLTFYTKKKVNISLSLQSKSKYLTVCT